jgi:hypothetical protein
MIVEIIQILKLDEFYGESKNIDIAKGIYKSPDSVKEAVKLANRRRRAKQTYGN